ncbi:chemotaxis protein CheC [Methanothermococcus sp.]|uniref:chemotaxis protein CheC n=1 Tax=Methanothermococcus sp. TaxID=2614238 RepID=UPI0025D15653|nr:chemotaxis protein CheC [Methanothermococcus sp.]
MKCGNIYVSPKSWNTIMQGIISEEIKENLSFEKNSKLIKNFHTKKLGKIEEIGKSAANKAANFISDMTGNPVNVGEVNVVIATPLEIKQVVKEDYKIFTGINFKGDVEGVGILVFSKDSALKLSKSMLAEMGIDDNEDSFNEMKISVINETCNIITSAFVDTLASYIGASLDMSPPSFIEGSEYTIIEKIFKNYGVDDLDILLTFKSELFSHGIGSGFEVLIVMPQNSVNSLFQKL